MKENKVPVLLNNEYNEFDISSHLKGNQLTFERNKSRWEQGRGKKVLKIRFLLENTWFITWSNWKWHLA